ncbi:hypothetical protein SISNIDRAFT_472705 [Sistotremastrum niveocremeum HHB9708]|uniref:non-specific serine/threonine protein kinase n=1 Tax=Sistotremastrum niveocremeum HHB9708 TaxID=1314777 RepID=A0A164ZKP6_9AGAM|nr:hypothetical protein SISNIDRAFT_472705 [Sistotremastrum niveocremeum HHB9708]
MSIKALAYVHLTKVAKARQKSPYSLLSPFMHQVGPFVVSRWVSQPSLVHELCRFLTLSPPDFISATLAQSLPHLVATRNTKVLEKVAQQLHTLPSTLILQSTHGVLAHVFLSLEPSETQRGLAFLVRILQDAAPDDEKAHVTVDLIVKSCLIPLLGELVIALGNQGDQNLHQAAKALREVEAILHSPIGGPVSQSDTSDIPSFLRPYLLGIIQHMNDTLGDVHGKKPVDIKRQVIRSIGVLVEVLGQSISSVSPQVMATMQSMVCISELTNVTLEAWDHFIRSLSLPDVRPNVGTTCAALVAAWPTLDEHGRRTAKQIFEYIIVDHGNEIGDALDDVVDIGSIEELRVVSNRLAEIRQQWSNPVKLTKMMDRIASDSLTVALHSLLELKQFMKSESVWFEELTSGDTFDPQIGKLVDLLFMTAARDFEGSDNLRMLVFECVGFLGAVDFDKFDLPASDSGVIVIHNFNDENESMQFALHLIKDVLIGAFRSTSDAKYQSHLAFAIQELLKFCGFTPDLLSNKAGAISIKVRNRWSTLPRHILDTISPLLESRFHLNVRPLDPVQHPIYPTQSTYREWLQLWITYLIGQATGPTAPTVFNVFRSAVRNKDVEVASHLLSHVVLNVAIGGSDEERLKIQQEMVSVLRDQVSPSVGSHPDKRMLCAQTIFRLMDHFSKWIRVTRQEQREGRKSRVSALHAETFERTVRVDSILTGIDEDLMARAAFECGAYARALMTFERQVQLRLAQKKSETSLQPFYERLHEIYAHLDEPDGMEGISHRVITPSLEHQIRQHESMGRWTSAQSCWEVRLQQSPDNPDSHLGLLRCLRNLGHYDTLRTHITGVLKRYPSWGPRLAEFQAEGAWMVQDWGGVENIVQSFASDAPELVMARVLLSIRAQDSRAIVSTLSAARARLGASIVAGGRSSYRRCYNAVLGLHMIHELEMICVDTDNDDLQKGNTGQLSPAVSRSLSKRLERTLPTFRTREPILSMRRVAFGLHANRDAPLVEEIGLTWLAIAKVARKAGHRQTSYSAILQARQNNAPFAFIQSCRLIKDSGEPLRALQELEHALQASDWIPRDDAIDLTDDDGKEKIFKAKALLLRAQWMQEADRFTANEVLQSFHDAVKTAPRHSAHFHMGHYHDMRSQWFGDRPSVMNCYINTIHSYSAALRHGNKYVYQTVPRLLTLWLDMGESDDVLNSLQEGSELKYPAIYERLNKEITDAIRNIPAYKWFTAFPQIVSRVGHRNPETFNQLASLITRVLSAFPKQCLWMFMAVVMSQNPERKARGRNILNGLKSHPETRTKLVSRLADECTMVTGELLALCDFPVANAEKPLSMEKVAPNLKRFSSADLIIPLQESLTVNLPSLSTLGELHSSFFSEAPTFKSFVDEVEIMRSLQKPRKITICGSDGQRYMFLGKPKDDLRKDARLMDFNSIINKLLKKNSDSRKRHLHIRTYGVITLNEECGFIQWVPNTIPLRPVLIKLYDQRGIMIWNAQISNSCNQIKDMTDANAANAFQTKILPHFPPLFHNWFLETFPEPSAWLASRLAYGRTAAVMSMVGFILGLGDRHCENILLDTNSGDVVHVDFSCLFEKGKTLETPERVPFRLTQNLVDGLGVTGVEGVFRIACEVTMQLLRDNRDSLMSVLDAFIHDPLVEWEDERKRLVTEASSINGVKPSVDLQSLARNALKPIDKKLKGLRSTIVRNPNEKTDKEFSTSNMVEALIREATSMANLVNCSPDCAQPD